MSWTKQDDEMEEKENPTVADRVKEEVDCRYCFQLLCQAQETNLLNYIILLGPHFHKNR